MIPLSCLSHVKRTSDGTRPPTPPLLTFIDFVVDRSGSMETIWAAGVTGIEECIKQQQALAKKTGAIAKVSLTTFATTAKTYWNNIPLESVKVPFTDKQKKEYFAPTSMTRLIDTQMERIISLKRRVRSATATMPKRIRDLKPKVVAVFVVQTDGQDNQSSFNERDLEVQMKGAREMGIQGIFLATNQDAYSVGKTFGFAGACTGTFAPTRAGTAAVYRSAAVALDRACSGGLATMTMPRQPAASAPAPQPGRLRPHLLYPRVAHPHHYHPANTLHHALPITVLASQQPASPPPPPPSGGLGCRQISCVY